MIARYIDDLTLRELKYISIGVVAGAATGYLLQILSRKYLKHHPELLENRKKNKKKLPKNKPTKPFILRGGQVVSAGAGVVGQILIKKIVIALSTNGAGILGTAGAGAGLLAFLRSLPRLGVIKFFNDAVPGNLASTSLIALDNTLLSLKDLDFCGNSLEYLSLILNDKSIPLEEKKKLASKVLKKHVNLEYHDNRVIFVVCMVSILFLFYDSNIGSFYLLMYKLLEAVRKGKISKKLARAILRKLRRRGVPVDPELIPD